MTDVRATLEQVFRKVFDDPQLVLREDMNAASIPEWDSLQHVNLIIATEKALGIRLNTGEISQLRQPGANVGTFLELLKRKVTDKP